MVKTSQGWSIVETSDGWSISHSLMLEVRTKESNIFQIEMLNLIPIDIILYR